MNPSDPEPLPSAGARRRSRRRFVLPASAGERAAFLNDLARRVTPSFDFFLFTLLAGLALAVALLLDAPALFVLAALLAPFLAPVAGLAFATILGSGGFLLRMLGALAIGTALMFGFGCLAGWLSHALPAAAYAQATLHLNTSWPDLILLVTGAALTALALVRSPQQRPLVTSVAMAYDLYLPAGASGFALLSNHGDWQTGLMVFGLHLSLAVLTGAVVLSFLGLRPLNAGGYLVSALLSLAVLAGLVWVNVDALRPAFDLRALIPTAAPTASPTATRDVRSATPAPSATASQTPSPTQPTRTPTSSLVPSHTHTQTITPAPTAAYAFIAADQGGGALVRQQPGFQEKLVKTVLNGILVEVLPERVQKDGVTWAKIRTPDGAIEGWIVYSLLTTATPAPGG